MEGTCPAANSSLGPHSFTSNHVENRCILPNFCGIWGPPHFWNSISNTFTNEIIKSFPFGASKTKISNYQLIFSNLKKTPCPIFQHLQLVPPTCRDTPPLVKSVNSFGCPTDVLPEHCQALGDEGDEKSHQLIGTNPQKNRRGVVVVAKKKRWCFDCINLITNSVHWLMLLVY